MTPDDIYKRFIGCSVDLDGYPRSNPFQCWDFMAVIFSALGIPVNTYCAITGYVCDIWRLKDQYGYRQYFDYIYRKEDLQDGDIVFWDKGSSHALSHVCMYYHGMELGQNQPERCVTLKNTVWDIIGALRPKQWTQYEKGYAECYDPDISGQYKVIINLHLRTGGDQGYHSICVMPSGAYVQNYGYYHRNKDGKIWLYVCYGELTGFACMDYLSL